MLRRIGKPVKLPATLTAVIADNVAVALFDEPVLAEQWRRENYKGRSDVTVEAVVFDTQKGNG